MQHLETLYTQKKGLDLQWEQEHLKEGRYTLDMVKIDRKVQKVIPDQTSEAEKADAQNKIDAAAHSSFCSYLIKKLHRWKNPIHTTGPLALYLNLLYKLITV